MSNQIPTNNNVPSMIPNDPKVWKPTEAMLANLGTNNYLAYHYYEGLRVLIAETKEIWEWREVAPGEENTGLVSSDFTYPAGVTLEGIDYSNRTFNFFKVLQASDISLPTITVYDANNVGTGAEVYRDTTGTGPITFNFRSLIQEIIGAGGQGLIESIVVRGDEVVVRHKSLGTTNLNIYVDPDGTVMIDSPVSSSNLSFYVDVNSTADTETGNLASPFKTLNKALDAFIGAVNGGTWYNPQYKGYKITLLSACSLLEAPGVDYNGYENLDINNLDIEGNGFYLGLYHNPSPDYYPISTRRMVLNMPKTANVLDYQIEMRFNNVVFQRTGTNAIIDNLNYSFPTATLAGAFPPQQNGVILWFTNCNLTNDTPRLPNPNWSTIANPNNGGNPLLMFGVPVYASASEPWGVPMIKTEGRNWNKEGSFRLGNSRLTNLAGPAIKAIDTTYQDFYEHNTIGVTNYFRFYKSEVDDYYSPRLGTYMIELEDVNNFTMGNLKLNWTIPRMNTTEVVPRSRIIGGVETLFKLTNSNLNIVGDSSDQDQVENLIQMDGNSHVTLDGYQNNGQVADTVHGAIKVVAPLPTPAKEITCNNVYLYSVIVDETGVDKSYLKQINGNKNTINGAPHTSYLQFADDAAAKAAGLIRGNTYYNTTIGGLKVVI